MSAAAASQRTFGFLSTRVTCAANRLLALGVKLGGDLHETGGVRYRPELGTGDDADGDYLSSAAGLIWRALVMWMFLIGIVTVAHTLG